MIIELTEEEMQRARDLATGRNSKLGKVRNDRVSGKLGDWQINFMGLRGEIAVGRFLGVPIDDRILPGGDGHRGDLHYGGKWIDVKTTASHPLWLKFPKLSNFKADIAVLCYLLADDVEGANQVDLLGATHRSWFVRKHERKDFGRGLHWGMPAAKLVPVEAFFGDSATRAARLA